ncbi:MAG: DMT family transporter [Flavobacteriaceae bacterium]|nr:DMT family transporter [Flavobacteriaceae bacterium]
MNNRFLKIFVLTSIALIAFAANSVLARLALGRNAIDASGYTSIRLLSGAIVLFIIIQFNNNKKDSFLKGNWLPGFMLFLYAVTFSYAYISLDTGTGALIIFGAVQITMIIFSIYSGNKLHITKWIGVIIAFAGFVNLVLPGVNTPSIIGFVLMTLSGIAWGIYTIIGLDSKNPLIDTSNNFIKTIPFVVILLIITFKKENYSLEGIILAVISGGITSAIGYTIWYMALRKLTSVQASVVQLMVPVIAALGGVLFMSEVITQRLAISSLLILGGILIVTLGKKYYISKN